MRGFAAVVLGVLLQAAAAWREWPHVGEGPAKWKRNWMPMEQQNDTYFEGPGGRYGHTMVLHDTQIILFGGRADEIQKTHIPKTYTVKDQNGTVDFASYWERVYDCDYLLRKARFVDPNATLESIRCNETMANRALIDTTFLWNDVWMYDLNCTRLWQEGCTNTSSQWQVLHEGAIDGGCKNFVEGRGGTREICTVPSERAFHGAARFNDSTMLIYGGFSHRCEEYCDDVWSFDLRFGRYIWTEIYPLDHFASGAGPGRRWKFSVVTDGISMAIFGGQTLWEGLLPENSAPTEESASSASINLDDDGGNGYDGSVNAAASDDDDDDGTYKDDDDSSSSGGAASDSNGYSGSSRSGDKYGDLSKGLAGGFLSDFWVFRKRPLSRGWGSSYDFAVDITLDIDFTVGEGSDPENYASYWEENPIDSGDYGMWEQVNRTAECLPDPKQNNWDERFNTYCRVFWPPERAGHVAVLDTTRNGMWLHGGFRTHYPYPSTEDLAKRGRSTQSHMPFGAYSYYLDDLWFYNFTQSRQDRYGGGIHHHGGRWVQIKPLSAHQPSGRMEHVMLMSGNILMLQGGFGVNHHMNDTWLFNITTTKWLQKHKFERARYPPNCTHDMDGELEELHLRFGDDGDVPSDGAAADAIAEIKSRYAGCFALRWPRDKKRDEYWPFDPLDDRQQDWYAPDFKIANRTNAYYGILDKGEHIEVGRLLANDSYSAPGKFGRVAPDGTPIVPYAKTGPRQYVRNVSSEEAFRLGLVRYGNYTINMTVYERCTSVYGVPTRNTLLDGQAGRHTETVMIAQPRRQRPGWDGCRDRHDNRSDLPLELQWDHPPQRSGHAAVFNQDYGLMMVYGGRGPAREERARDDKTFDFLVKYDFWQFSVDNCANNCSNHGFCAYGFCTCEDGYYGYDCSNSSCPGDYCYYDEFTHEQVCQHCCSAGYNHTDDDVYIDNADSYKVPCSRDEPGYSHGICDGFGTCQCAPPFLGDDCSVKDCLHDCSYNGYCSVEYPVSRCVCNPSYFGEFCEQIECLNNCSYPNGVCDYTEGVCACNHLYNPYDNTRLWATSWENNEVRWEGEDCSYITAYAAATRTSTINAVSLGLVAASLLVATAVLGVSF